MQQTNPRRPLIRRSFILVLLCVIGLGYWYFIGSVDGGGQIANSPDGRLTMDVWRGRNGPYVVSLREYETGRILRKLSIHLVDDVPNQILRGGPRVIAWDDSSQFADLIFDGRPYCRVFVPTSAIPSSAADDAR